MKFYFVSFLAILSSAVLVALFSGTSLLIGLIVVFVIYSAVVALGVSFIQLQFFGPAICRGNKDQTSVALTFDDGPDPEVTPFVLDWLKQNDLKAMFFCIGKKVKSHPELAKRIVEEGHLIGNHTYHHFYYHNFFVHRRLKRELADTNRVIKEISDQEVEFHRPPVGLTNPHTHYHVHKMGMKIVGWQFRTLDRNTTDPADTVARIMKRLNNGSILLLHDGDVRKEPILQVLEELLPRIKQRGFTIQRLDEMLD